MTDSIAKAITDKCDKLENAPRERSGERWEGGIGGFCPVQGTGTVDGLNWYFRARHDGWTFEVWSEPFRAGRLPNAPAAWGTFGEYVNASWMPYGDAWALIEGAIALGRAQGWKPRAPRLEAAEDECTCQTSPLALCPRCHRGQR